MRKQEGKPWKSSIRHIGINTSLKVLWNSVLYASGIFNYYFYFTGVIGEFKLLI